VLETTSVEPTENGNAIDIERRAWVRCPCNLESTCQPLAGARGLQWPGKIRNLSAGGLALTLARRFEVGTILSIDVLDKAESVLGTWLARVAHVTLQSDGTWLLGCAFTTPRNEEDLQASR
jgi:hypothetical protein